MKVVWVKWVDSTGQDGWTGRADAQALRCAEFLHVGFVIYEDDLQVTLSPTTYINGHVPITPYHSPISIPKVAIKARGDIVLPLEGPDAI